MGAVETSRWIQEITSLEFEVVVSVLCADSFELQARRYIKSRRTAEIFRFEGGQLAADLLDNVHFAERPGCGGLGQMGFH